MSHREHEQVVMPAPEHVESWHQHSSEEAAGVVEHGSHVNITLLSVFIALIVVTVILIVIGIGSFTKYQLAKHMTEAEYEGMHSRVKVVKAYKEQAFAAQQGYGRTSDGKIKLPIERAMELVVQEAGAHSKQ